MLPSKICSFLLLSLTSISFLAHTDSFRFPRIKSYEALKFPRSEGRHSVGSNIGGSINGLGNSYRPFAGSFFDLVESPNASNDNLKALNRKISLRGRSGKSMGAISALGSLVGHLVDTWFSEEVDGSHILSDDSVSTELSGDNPDASSSVSWSEIDGAVMPYSTLFPIDISDKIPNSARKTSYTDDYAGDRQRHRRKRRGIEPVDPSEIASIPKELLRATPMLSELSYHSTEVLAKTGTPEILELLRLQADGFPIFLEGDKSLDTQAYVWLFKDTKTLFVSFRGTNSLTDIKHDLDYRLMPLDSDHPTVKVHAGFRNKFKSIEAGLISVLDEHLKMFDKIALTGHSLGGALASLAAPLLGEKYPSKSIHCLTFGSPRVGDRGFVDWFNSYVDSNFRLINEGDPVTAIPLDSTFLHVSDAISISQSGEVSKVPEAPPGKRLWYALEDFDLKGFVKEHNMETYAMRLTSFLPQTD
jgi:hypothetical protein